MAFVLRDREFLRIEKLPRRNLPAPCLVPGLRGDQPLMLGALREAAAMGPEYGALIQAPVGSGKTLPFFLAPGVLASKRYLQVVPAHLRDKTKREWEHYARMGFALPPLHLASYHDLSGQKWGSFLVDDLDLVVCDEAQELRHLTSAKSKKVFDFFVRNPQVRFVCLSATLLTDTINDVRHLADWALRDRSPMPRDYYTARMWSEALDPSTPAPVRPNGDVFHRWPGATGASPLEKARAGFACRLQDTPGVYFSTAQSSDVPLYIHPVEYRLDGAIALALDKLRSLWVRPDEHQLLLATEFAMAAKSLALGFYHCWEEYPPQEWYDARSNWASRLKVLLRGRSLDVYTELDAKQRYPHDPALLEWERQQGMFKPTPRVAWVSTAVLEQVVWRDGHIVWVKSPEVGRKLSEVSGVPFYDRGGKNGEDLEKGTGNAIASWKAHGTGRNLQRFWRATILEPPTQAATFEQLIGRHRRQGQTECVHIEVPTHTHELVTPWETTLAQAVALEQVGRQPQSVLRAILPST